MLFSPAWRVGNFLGCVWCQLHVLFSRARMRKWGNRVIDNGLDLFLVTFRIKCFFFFVCVSNLASYLSRTRATLSSISKSTLTLLVIFGLQSLQNHMQSDCAIVWYSSIHPELGIQPGLTWISLQFVTYVEVFLFALYSIFYLLNLVLQNWEIVVSEI